MWEPRRLTTLWSSTACCMYKGWAIKLALASRPLMIYCASPLAAAMIITVAALRIVLPEASQHSLLAACFTLHSINATLAIVPHRGAGLWIPLPVTGITLPFFISIR
jgi:hypothetical protein